MWTILGVKVGSNLKAAESVGTSLNLVLDRGGEWEQSLSSGGGAALVYLLCSQGKGYLSEGID